MWDRNIDSFFVCFCLSVCYQFLCVTHVCTYISVYVYIYIQQTQSNKNTQTHLSISWGWRRNAYRTASIAVAWTCPGLFECTRWFLRRCSWTNTEQDVVEPRSCTGTTFFWLCCSNLWSWFWRCTLCWLWQQVLIGRCIAVQKLSVCTLHLLFLTYWRKSTARDAAKQVRMTYIYTHIYIYTYVHVNIHTHSCK